MKSRYLLPHLYKKIGGILFLLTFGTWVLGTIMNFSYSWVDYNTTKGSQGNFADEIIVTGLIISLLMIAFSKEKNEDEYIAAVRRESLQWAIYINYGLLLIGTWGVLQLGLLHRIGIQHVYAIDFFHSSFPFCHY